MILLDQVNTGKAREFLFNPTSTYIGVACNCHPTYTSVCVVIFSDRFLTPKMNSEIDVAAFNKNQTGRFNITSKSCKDICDRNSIDGVFVNMTYGVSK